MTSFMERVIAADVVEVRRDGDLAVAVKIPWYRSLALSTVEGIEVAVDGVPVPAEHVRFELDGVVRRLDELAPLWQQNWFIQDAARLRLTGVQPVGSRVRVTVELTMRIPYILVGPGEALRHHVREERTLDLAEVAA